MSTNFFSRGDAETLLKTKASLQEIKDSHATLASKKASLIQLLPILAVLNKITGLSPNHKISAWLLMADVYGYLSFIHGNNASKTAAKCLDDSIECIEKAQGLVDTHENYTWDAVLIYQLNTLGVGTPQEALEVIQKMLLPHLLKQTATQALFKVFTESDGAADNDFDSSTPRTGPG